MNILMKKNWKLCDKNALEFIGIKVCNPIFIIFILNRISDICFIQWTFSHFVSCSKSHTRLFFMIFLFLFSLYSIRHNIDISSLLYNQLYSYFSFFFLILFSFTFFLWYWSVFQQFFLSSYSLNIIDLLHREIASASAATILCVM